MKFSIIHPTARLTFDFASPWWHAEATAFLGCDNPREVEYLIVVHHSRIPEFRKYCYFACPLVVEHWGRFTIVTNYGRDCLVDQCNAGMLAASGDIWVGNQDDMRFPKHWDSEISKLIPDPSERICIRVDDGRPEFVIQTIVTKSLQHAMGPISPDYDGMYIDNEFSAKVNKYGKVISSNLHFEHLHWVHGTAKLDSVYQQENRDEAYRIGLETFQRRQALGFPRVSLPGWPVFDMNPEPRRSTSPWTAGGIASRAADWFERTFNPPTAAPIVRRSVIACLPDESAEKIACLFNLNGAVLNLGFDFAAIPGYASSPDVTREMIASNALEYSASEPGRFPYIYWQDDDNVIEPRQFQRLVNFLEATPQADIIVGWCWICRAGGWTTSLAQFSEDMGSRWLTLQELYAGGDAPKRIEGLASGFPCVLMRREVLEKLTGQAFRKIPSPTAMFGFLGEDFSFMWRAWKAGFNCYVDPQCKVGHIKPQPQEPDLESMLKAFPPEVRKARRQINGKPVDDSMEKVMP